MHRFLVIGGSGFIGRHLLRTLAKKPSADVLGTGFRHAQSTLIPFDIASDSILDQLPNDWRTPGANGWAILCAAVVPMDRCATEPDFARAVMIEGSQRCLADLSRAGFRPVFLSTSYVFDGQTGGYAEDDVPNPISRYGSLKLEMEAYLRRAIPEALILRLDKTVSAEPTEQHLFSEWHDLARQRRPLVCIRGQQFGLTSVTDIVEAIHRACTQQLSGIYHVANPRPSQREQLARRFLEVMQLQSEVKSVPLESLGLPEPRPLRSWLCTDKIQKALGFEFTSVENVLAEYRRRVVARGTAGDSEV